MTRLIADIGGTNVRFGIADTQGIAAIKVMACADFASLADATAAYLDATKAGKPDNGAFAIAAPLDGTDRVSMPNHSWDFSIDDTRRKIGLSNLRIINDFAALAYGVPFLTDSDRTKLRGGSPRAAMPIGIIGPGTGLGVAAVVFDAKGNPVPVTTEGGHVTMAATTQREYDLMEYLRRTKYHHISAERVVSGKGIVNLYHAIAGVDGIELPEKDPAEVTRAALDGSCRVSAEALDLFCHFLGVAAGNLALTLGAFGGIYIAGGIVPQLGDYFKNSRFNDSFTAKGRYKDYLEPVPVYLITHPYPGLEGLRHIA
jgi:glucokinase